MAKQSPKEMFEAKWSSKKDAAAAIVALIGDHDGKTAQRLKSVSNGKLLKLYAAGEEIERSSRTGKVSKMQSAQPNSRPVTWMKPSEHVFKATAYTSSSGFAQAGLLEALHQGQYSL